MLYVLPGDVVSADMVRTKKGWTLTFDDVTQSAVRTKNLTYKAAGGYHLAEWTQEDPTTADITAVDVPYPSLSTVQFSHLLLNGTVPKLTLADAQVLIPANGPIAVPTAVRAGAFSFATPKGAQLEYLTDVRPIDAANTLFDVELVRWTKLSKAKRLAAAGAFARANQVFAHKLTVQTFPAKARRDALLLAKRSIFLATASQAWMRAGCLLKGPAYDRVISYEGIGPQATLLRADLGLPPP
jgi:hypothetical protein